MPGQRGELGARQGCALAPVAAHIAALAAAAPVRCLDETGFRVAGKGQWLHTVATGTLTHYRVSAKRGEMPEGLVGGVAVHDGFKSYSGLADVGHALCNAHHLRELKALVEIDREPWAAPMRDLLLEANRAVERAREAGANSLPPPVLEGFFARYWEILRLGLAFHRNLPRLQRHPSNRGRTKHRPGHNLLIRLHEFKDDVLRFLVDFSVPFTNNLAEQALRMMKVKMKISGAFRNLRSRLRLRRRALGRRNRPQAGLEYPPDPDRSPSFPPSDPGRVILQLGSYEMDGDDRQMTDDPAKKGRDQGGRLPATLRPPPPSQSAPQRRDAAHLSEIPETAMGGFGSGQGEHRATQRASKSPRHRLITLKEQRHDPD